MPKSDNFSQSAAYSQIENSNKQLSSRFSSATRNSHERVNIPHALFLTGVALCLFVTESDDMIESGEKLPIRHDLLNSFTCCTTAILTENELESL